MTDARLAACLSEYRRIVVTGASSGIGAALVRELLRLAPGGRVCNLSRSAPREFLEWRNLRHIPCDLTRPEQAEAAIAQVRDWLATPPVEGRVLLINNSGFGSYGAFPEPGTERQLAMIELNVRAPVRLTAALQEELAASRGAVMNIASLAAFQPTPFMATYGASKAFMLNWSLALAEDWRPRGVTVLAVCPGPTSSAFFRSAGFETAPMAGSGGQTSEQVARESLTALARRKTLVVCGWKNKVLASLSGRLPKTLCARLTALILRKLRLERHQRAARQEP